jgi:hypothetical protein
VMIYQAWLPPAPASWTRVAEFHLKTRPAHVSVYSDTVVLYATPEANLPSLRGKLGVFSHTLPEGSWMTFPDEPTTHAALPSASTP